MDATPATAAAADITAPKTAMLANGVVTEGTGSGGGGGGGASNYVKGTFKGTTTGTAMDVNIPYTGNGYPIALLITPTEGPDNPNTGTFYNTLQQSACAMFFVMKNAADAAPSYSGLSADAYTGINRYKNSSSDATKQTSASINNNTAVCNDASAISTIAGIVRIRAKNKISVYIAGTNYGFMANIEYTYHIIYSE